MHKDLETVSSETLSSRKPVLPNPFVSAMKQYEPAPQEVWQKDSKKGLLKLDWNESTCLNPALHQVMIKLFTESENIYWYPDVNCAQLTAAITEHLSLTPPEILVFAGSDEALEAVCSAYLQAGDCVATVNPSYDNFRVYVERLGAVIKPVYFESSFQFDLNSFLQQANLFEAEPKLIYLVSPNNPIGYKVKAEDIEVLLEQFPDTIVVVDEAYVEFAGDSCCQLIQEYPNLIVVRSFSKAFGLAGLRIGYTASDMRNHAHLAKVRNGKNITMFAQRAAKYLLENFDYV